MSKENDLEGAQDQGGKHGGQAGIPRPALDAPLDQGTAQDEHGKEQPRDKARADEVSRKGDASEPPAQ